jgi:hypothetical protein
MNPVPTIYPIFILDYFTEDEFRNKIAYLMNEYSIEFNDKDKRYPYANDYSDFKKYVIECVNPLTDEQAKKFISNTEPYGMDMLYNEKFGYIYFVGDNGEDLTKNTINKYNEIIQASERDLNNSEIQRKTIGDNQMEVFVPDYEDEYGFPNDMSNYMPTEDDKEININITIKKEAQTQLKAHPVFKVKVPLSDAGTDNNMFDNAIQYLKKHAKIKFSDKDLIFNDPHKDQFFEYHTIYCAEPIEYGNADNETLKALASLSEDFGQKERYIRGKALSTNQNPEKAQEENSKYIGLEIYMSFVDNIYEGMSEFDLLARVNNLTKNVFVYYDNMTEEDMLEKTKEIFQAEKYEF